MDNVSWLHYYKEKQAIEDKLFRKEKLQQGFVLEEYYKYPELS